MLKLNKNTAGQHVGQFGSFTSQALHKRVMYYGLVAGIPAPTESYSEASQKLEIITHEGEDGTRTSEACYKPTGERGFGTSHKKAIEHLLITRQGVNKAQGVRVLERQDKAEAKIATPKIIAQKTQVIEARIDQQLLEQTPSIIPNEHDAIHKAYMKLTKAELVAIILAK